MDFRYISEQIDMIIGKVENEVHIKMNENKKNILNRINELLSNLSDNETDKYIALNRLKQDVERMNTETYRHINNLVVAASILSYVHVKVGTFFLFSQITNVEHEIEWAALEKLKAKLTNPVEARTLNKKLSIHNQRLTDEVIAAVQTKVFNDIDAKITKQTVEKVFDKYERYTQSAANLEIGRAQSIASLDSEDEFNFTLDMFQEDNSKKPWTKIEDGKYDVKIRRMWLSQRDGKVRATHKALDGNTVDKDNLFHSAATKTKGPAPRMMEGVFALQENMNCRCSVGFKIGNIELDNIEQSTMSKEHAEIYEKTQYDEYIDHLKYRGDDIKPHYYDQMSDTVMFDKSNKSNKSMQKDAAKFKEMLDRGFHKKSDGTWGY